MEYIIYEKKQMLRTLLVLSSLLFTTLVSAQQSLFDASVDYQKEKNIFLHNGEPLNGCYKVTYITDDFIAYYYIADFKDGVRGDTIRHYDAKSNTLINENIRLNDRETLHRQFFFDGKCFEEYRTTDKGREGIYREWYKSGKLRAKCEYVDGLLNGSSAYWDENGQLMEVVNYKNNLQDGWSKTYIYEDSQSKIPAKMVRDLYSEGGSPVLEECFGMGGERPMLTKRTIFDSTNSAPRCVSFKDECDSTRIDSLENSIEIRDYRQGKLLSIERYTYYWERDGIFETYNTEGGMASRKRYERDRLIAESYYDFNELSPDVQQITLTSAMCAAFKLKSCNSKYFDFDKCDTERPLVIRNPFGNELFSVRDEGRRYEYYGYDPKLKYHLAFSSVGDFNDVYYYVVHDDGASMSLSVDYVAVNGDAGTVATMRRIFDDEDELVIYNFRPENKEEGFIPVLKYSVRHATYLTGLHWLGNGTLLLEYKDDGIRLDIDPAELELTDDDELY